MRYRHGARILMYHRFPERSHLAAQCAHLQKYYRPVSLTEIGHWLRHEQTLPTQAVVFTVDDGYRDFYLNTFPVLLEYSIPAIVYLATEMIDRQTCLWVDWVGILFSAAQRPASAARETKERFKTLPNAERLERLAQLPEQLGLASPPPIPEQYAPLTWEDIRVMSKAGIEFGAHTQSHPILSRLASREEIQNELAGSKARIEQETGQPVRHFCYPNGRESDFDAVTLDVVRECGFLTAVTGEKGINFAGADPFQLRRIHQEPVTPVLQFAHQVAGLSR